jgi:probable HAF family extracellular repeat protein
MFGTFLAVAAPYWVENRKRHETHSTNCHRIRSRFFPIWFANAQPSISWAYDFVKLDYPGAAVSFPLGINATRQIVGVRIDAAGVNHGYFYSNGKFTDIDFPGAAAIPGGGTFTGGINDRGDVAGVYTHRKGFQHGFMRTYAPGCDQTNSHCQPAFHTIDVPGAVQTQKYRFRARYGIGKCGGRHQ